VTASDTLRSLSAGPASDVLERVLVAGLEADERAHASELARTRLAYLAAVGQRVSASLESATIIQTLVDSVIPDLADAAVAKVNDHARSQPRVAFAMSDRLAARPFEAWVWLDRTAAHAARRVVQRGSIEHGSTREPRRALGVSHPARNVSYVIVPLRASGRVLGTLSLFSFADEQRYGPDECTLAEAIGAQAGLALRNAQLYEQQVSTIARLERTRANLTLDAARLSLDERRRIGRELHDGLEQTLFAIALTTSRALSTTSDDAATPLSEALRQAGDLARAGAEQLRVAIFALNEDDSRKGGLVSQLVKQVRAMQQRTGIQADMTVSGHKTRIPAHVGEALRAIARESLANVERHAHASAVVLSLHYGTDEIVFTAQDDGVGPSALVLDQLEHSATHFGLSGMRERVERLNGTFTATRGPDGGFLIRARIPHRGARR
jgi:signal transduction histidine kinase